MLWRGKYSRLLHLGRLSAESGLQWYLQRGPGIEGDGGGSRDGEWRGEE